MSWHDIDSLPKAYGVFLTEDSLEPVAIFVDEQQAINYCFTLVDGGISALRNVEAQFWNSLEDVDWNATS